jgi:hypothetical protein
MGSSDVAEGFGSFFPHSPTPCSPQPRGLVLSRLRGSDAGGLRLPHRNVIAAKAGTQFTSPQRRDQTR